MGLKWVLFFVAFIGSHSVNGFPLRSTQPSYPVASRASTIYEEWSSAGGLYAVLPALGLLVSAVGLVFGCTWCYRHKDCKIFAASAPHLHDLRRNIAPDSGFSEPVNNNVAEDNNNGPISLRELQNIANNNAAVYIASDNEQRNRSRESVVEFEPLPTGIRVADPLEHCADWFDEDFQRNKLQYLREIGRGWFGRVVEGEIEVEGGTSTVAVKILNQNTSLEDKARFLDEAKIYRDMRHENVLAFVTKCLEEDPWVLIFELCSMDLQQYLVANRPKMAILNESGVPLQLMCDVASGLSYLHSQRFVYGNLWTGNLLVRTRAESVRAVVGQYAASEPPHDCKAPELARHSELPTMQSDVWSLGTLVWETCAWGASPPHRHPPPPDLPCPYRNHLYQVMQLCWNPSPESRPTSAQVYALINHLYVTHSQSSESTQDDGYGSSDFEERWQRLKPNTIPKIDEHIAIVHAPSSSMASHFTESEQEFSQIHTVQDSLNVDYTIVSRSSSIMSDKDPLSAPIKSESLTNLHGSLEDVRNIYLTHNETAVLECHQANYSVDDRDNDRDRSDNSVDPWLKDIMAGSQDDVSYYKDVSDVIKNLDNILNSEKTSSSESSHQASPSRDNLSLECKKQAPLQSNMVKSPGIINFQNVLEIEFQEQSQEDACDDEVDRDTIGTLSHSFERHSDSNSQHTLENLTPVTPVKDEEIISSTENYLNAEIDTKAINKSVQWEIQQPIKNKIDNSDISIPTLKELCLTLMPTSSVSLKKTVCKRLDQSNVLEDCHMSNDLKEIVSIDNKQKGTKSLDYTLANALEHRSSLGTIENLSKNNDLLVKDFVLPECIEELASRNGDSVLNSKTTCTELHNTFLDEDKSSRHIADIKVDNSEDTIEYIENAFKSNNQKVCSDLAAALDTRSLELVFDKKEEDNDFLKSKPDLIPELSKSASNTNINEIIRNPIIQSEIPEQTAKSFIKNNSDTNSYTAQAIIIKTPELVQKNQYTENVNTNEFIDDERATKTESVSSEISAPEIVQNIVRNKEIDGVNEHENIFEDDEKRRYNSNDSTIYMDLVNDKKTNILKHDSPGDNVKESIKSCFELTGIENSCYLFNNESTVYLSLPKVVKDTDYFLHTERLLSSQQLKVAETFCASTPRGSDISADNTFDNTVKDSEKSLSETIVPNNGQGLIVTKLEQKYALENVSPMESPTKSHHTDTFDENSSVVLGPFENCTLDLFKGLKSNTEELLAFSSNFSEIDLETPSPLRDGNFLNEVPDILHDDVHFDDIENISEVKNGDKTDTPSENNSDKTDVKSITEKHMSPLTPPNSPGDFLTTTLQQKYLVNIDLTAPNEQVPKINSQPDSHSSILQNEIYLNQNELQITTKLAIAENENNMNIEYSSPLIVEGLVTKEIQEENAVHETYLAGNGGTVDDTNKGFSLDAESMKALRDELEIKLPLAQVAAIEPQFENDAWSGELPPPPELIVSYPGALSPIVEETGQQLTAYENDINWNLSIRTDSSESYPEPCNNSTDEVTDLPTGVQSDPRENSTYTIHAKENSLNNTYTIQKDVPSSKEFTMSDDSLNARSLKKFQDENETLNKNSDEKESFCERISQVSPYLVSPTTDTSAPMNSDNIDNVTGVSSLSKTSQPTDAKVTKPSDTQCLSKATSIDSWCSNDTLYNVEENFDDLVMDTDVLVEENRKDDGNSESSNTLTHQGMDDQKESINFIHESQSEHCETFSPDSISANDNCTYTKIKTETGDISPLVTKSYINDSTKNSQTKDLAYGSLISGLPSCSNYTTEIISGIDELWKLPQPELIRRSPVTDEIDFTITNLCKEPIHVKEDSPKLITRSHLNKMDSVEISCLHNASLESRDKSENFVNSPKETQVQESPKEFAVNDNWNYHFRNMANSISSTPLTEQIADKEDIKGIPMQLPQQKSDVIDKVTNFENFLYSAELRPQDMSGNTNNENSSGNPNMETVEGDKNSHSNTGNCQSTASYIHFENSVLTKPQDTQSFYISSSDENSINIKDQIKIKSCHQSIAGISDSMPNYVDFENSATSKPQNSLQGHDIDKNKTSDSSSCLLVATDSISNHKDFEHFATKTPQDSMHKTEINLNQSTEVVNNNNLVFFSDSTTDCVAFGDSAIDKQHLLQGCEIEPNKHLTVVESEGSAMVVSDLKANYSDFKNSVTNKPQDLSRKNEIASKELTKASVDSNTKFVIASDPAANYSDFESSVIYKSQDSMQIRDSSPEKCNKVVSNDGGSRLVVSDSINNYSDFEASAFNKPQDSPEANEISAKEITEAFVDSSTKLDIASDHVANYSDFESSVTNKPQDLMNHSEICAKRCTKVAVNDGSHHLIAAEYVFNCSGVKSSATKKAQELSNKSEIISKQSTEVTVNDGSNILVASDPIDNSDITIFATNKPQELPQKREMSSKKLEDSSHKPIIDSDSVANYTDLKNPAVNKSQDLSQKSEIILKELNEIAVHNSTNLVDVSNSTPNFNSENCIIDKTEDSLHNSKISLKEHTELTVDDSSNSMMVSGSFSNYSDFEKSATSKPQDSEQTSSQSFGSSSDNFKQFELSARNRPQDLLLVGDSVPLFKKLVTSSEVVTTKETDLEQNINNKNAEQDSKASKADFDHSVIHFQDVQTSTTSSHHMESEPQDLVIDGHFSSEINMIKKNSNERTSLIEKKPNNDIHNTETLGVSNIGSNESQDAQNKEEIINAYVTVYDFEEETEQPHSFIVTENPNDSMKEKSNNTYDSHGELYCVDLSHSYDSHSNRLRKNDKMLKDTKGVEETTVNGIDSKYLPSGFEIEQVSGSKAWTESKLLEKKDTSDIHLFQKLNMQPSKEVSCNGNGSQKFATVNILNETFEELLESNVDDNDTKDVQDLKKSNTDYSFTEHLKSTDSTNLKKETSVEQNQENEPHTKSLTENEGKIAISSISDGKKMTSVTEFFLWNEKKFCQLDYYLPLLNDIRFTGPASEIMSTSFTQESPTEPSPPEDEIQGQSNTAADILKDWDSDSDSHSTNSSSGEFIWKQRESGATEGGIGDGSEDRGGVESTSGDSGSGSGSEGDEVEFVPSSWDCRAAPAKSSLRSLEQAPPESKKRVVFKRQKYHCVYEYPREIADVECDAYVPDFSTYAEWEPAGTEEAELGYGQLFAAPSPLDLYPLRAGVAFDYDEDFFISSSARPFESLGLMSTSSQFFPGMHLKSGLIDRDVADDVGDDVTDHVPTWTPSLDFTTPDSGVEDITPSTTTDEDYQKKLSETECWKPVDSGSSSESVSPSSPGGETLGGLRHTRDKLKLDLPPSPHMPSPRHNRVFNFVLDKPKRKSQEEQPSIGTTPLVMTDETPIITTTLSLHNCDELTMPEPTFSTFGKSLNKSDQRSGIILTDEVNSELKENSDSKVNMIEDVKVIEAVKGEGTVLDSGDEDSGIESSSKATLERKTTPNLS